VRLDDLKPAGTAGLYSRGILPRYDPHKRPIGFSALGVSGGVP
jgi:hypothetical protein